MLSFDVQWIDVLPFLLSSTQPVGLLRREVAHSGQKAWAGQSQIGRVGEFWVPTSSLVEPNAQFTVTRIGDLVRVPLFPFRTIERQTRSIFGLGVQIGLAAAIELRKHTHDVPQRVVLVLGSECTDLAPAEDCFRCYVGIALQTK